MFEATSFHGEKVEMVSATTEDCMDWLVPRVIWHEKEDVPTMPICLLRLLDGRKMKHVHC